MNVVPLLPWEREALSGHGGCYRSGGGGFFVLFCSFKISSQNQRFPNDCINSKQTNKPKTKSVFSTKPICEAGLASRGSLTSASFREPVQGTGLKGLPQVGGHSPRLSLLKHPGKKFTAPEQNLRRLWEGGSWGLCRWVEELKTGAGLAALLGALTLWGLGDVD